MFEKRVKWLVLLVAGIGAGITLFAYGQAAWHSAGWRTPAQVAADIAAVEKNTAAQIAGVTQTSDKALAQVADFRVEYKCDKLKAEIARVRELPPTIANAAELARLEAIYERDECVKYEAF